MAGKELMNIYEALDHGLATIREEKQIWIVLAWLPRIVNVLIEKFRLFHLTFSILDGS